MDIPFRLNCLSTYLPNKDLITAAVGTANNMPQTPKKPPPISMESIIQKGFNPTCTPSILGPKYNPSNCCNKNMNM